MPQTVGVLQPVVSGVEYAILLSKQ
jgi:hypothetical protein